MFRADPICAELRNIWLVGLVVGAIVASHFYGVSYALLAIQYRGGR